MSLKIFTQEDEDTWVIENFTLPASRQPIRVSCFHEGDKFGISHVKTVEKVLSDVGQYITKASRLILENYSKEYFSRLGVPASNLPEDTPESVEEHITLTEVYFSDMDELIFEMSFEASWDDHHSFDVEFEQHEPQTCAVNG